MECIHIHTYTLYMARNRRRKGQKVLKHESVKRNVFQMLKTWSQVVNVNWFIYELPWFLYIWALNSMPNVSFMLHAIGFNAQIDIKCICDIRDKMFTRMRFRVFSSLQAMTCLNSSSSAKTMNEYQTRQKKSQKLRATRSKTK